MRRGTAIALFVALLPATALGRSPECPADDPDAAGRLASDFATAAAAACNVSASDLGATALGRAIGDAKVRLDLKLAKIPDAALGKALVAAAKRGVDVHVYVVAKKPADGATVLASEGLEASGVDVTVDTEDHAPGIAMIADGVATVANETCELVEADDSADAGKTFESAIAEPAAVDPAPLAKESVALLGMPDATGAEIAGRIRAAKTSIDLEIYQLQSPAITAALIDAQNRGVKVRVMLEPKTVGAANYTAEAKILSDAGIDVKATPPDFDSHRNVDHAKFMIVDGEEMLFGTGNLVRSGTGGNAAREFDNRDFWLRDNRQQSVKEATSLFAADWARKSTSGIDFKNMVVTPDNADTKILGLIDGAKSRVLVWNQSLSDDRVVASLIAAKERGADVHVLLGFQPGFGAPPKNQAAIDKLAAAGIPADYYTRNYLHAKGIVADDSAYLGSQNFTNGGLVTNREVGEIVSDANVVDSLAKTFADDEGHKKPTR